MELFGSEFGYVRKTIRTQSLHPEVTLRVKLKRVWTKHTFIHTVIQHNRGVNTLSPRQIVELFRSQRYHRARRDDAAAVALT